MPFHGSAKRKCAFFTQHHGHGAHCHCNHNFVCLAQFSCLRLCAGRLKNNSNNKRICIAPYGHHFRGAGARQCATEKR